jgi:hypothetical protein
MKLESVKLCNLTTAPWRLSDERPCTQEVDNVKHSLDTYGQLRPILVRPLDNGQYQIIDGHVVADAARKIGKEEIYCVVHTLSEDEARLIYIHLKLNRTVRNHVQIRRVFKQVNDVALLHRITSWPEERIRTYLALADRDPVWDKFDTGEDKQDQPIFE